MLPTVGVVTRRLSPTGSRVTAPEPVVLVLVVLVVPLLVELGFGSSLHDTTAPVSRSAETSGAQAATRMARP
jgi:hypothetical protein